MPADPITPSRAAAWSNSSPTAIDPATAAFFDNTAASSKTPSNAEAFSNVAPSGKTPANATAWDGTAPEEAEPANAAFFDNTAASSKTPSRADAYSNVAPSGKTPVNAAVWSGTSPEEAEPANAAFWDNTAPVAATNPRSTAWSNGHPEAIVLVGTQPSVSGTTLPASPTLATEVTTLAAGTNYLVQVGSRANPVTITLPDPGSLAQRIEIADIANLGAVYAITVNGGTKDIETTGVKTFVINRAGAVLTLSYTGTYWKIL